MDTIGRIKQTMDEKKITQRELAKAIGVEHSTVSNWLAGKYKIRTGHIAKIANCLGVSSNYLLSGAPDAPVLHNVDVTNNLPAPDTKKIAVRIKEAMKAKKVTQQALADEIGVLQPTVSSWVRGQTTPTVDYVVKIADCLEVPVDYLLGGQYRKYVVFYCDLLGTKDDLDAKKVAAFAKLVTDVVDNINNIVGEPYTFESKCFSDNFVFAVEYSDDATLETAFSFVVTFANQMFHLALMEYGLLIRGGIVCGELLITTDIVLGEALVRAYKLEEEIANYPRVIIDNSTLRSIQKVNAKRIENCTLIDFDEEQICNWFSVVADGKHGGVREKLLAGREAAQGQKGRAVQKWNYLLWSLEEMQRRSVTSKLLNDISPAVTKALGSRNDEKDFTDNISVVTLQEIGTVAAGAGTLAVEYPTGRDVDIPVSMLVGRPQSDYFVLRVKGDSMYPRLIEGDSILCLRCGSVDSGDYAVVMYNGEEATVKQVIYTYGEDWLELRPVNPEYAPLKIENSDLENVRVLGKVVRLIRDM